MKDYKLSEVVKVCEKQDHCKKCKFYNHKRDYCYFVDSPALWVIDKENKQEVKRNERLQIK